MFINTNCKKKKKKLKNVSLMFRALNLSVEVMSTKNEASRKCLLGICDISMNGNGPIPSSGVEMKQQRSTLGSQ